MAATVDQNTCAPEECVGMHVCIFCLIGASDLFNRYPFVKFVVVNFSQLCWHVGEVASIFGHNWDKLCRK